MDRNPAAKGELFFVVTVPPGVRPGEQLTLQTPDGEQMTVEVPDGCPPGRQFQVALDPDPAHEQEDGDAWSHQHQQRHQQQPRQQQQQQQHDRRRPPEREEWQSERRQERFGSSQYEQQHQRQRDQQARRRASLDGWRQSRHAPQPGRGHTSYAAAPPVPAPTGSGNASRARALENARAQSLGGALLDRLDQQFDVGGKRHARSHEVDPETRRYGALDLSHPVAAPWLLSPPRGGRRDDTRATRQGDSGDSGGIGAESTEHTRAQAQALAEKLRTRREQSRDELAELRAQRDEQRKLRSKREAMHKILVERERNVELDMEVGRSRLDDVRAATAALRRERERLLKRVESNRRYQSSHWDSKIIPMQRRLDEHAADESAAAAELQRVQRETEEAELELQNLGACPRSATLQQELVVQLGEAAGLARSVRAERETCKQLQMRSSQLFQEAIVLAADSALERQHDLLFQLDEVDMQLGQLVLAQKEKAKLRASSAADAAAQQAWDRENQTNSVKLAVLGHQREMLLQQIAETGVRHPHQ